MCRLIGVLLHSYFRYIYYIYNVLREHPQMWLVDIEEDMSAGVEGKV